MLLLAGLTAYGCGSGTEADPALRAYLSAPLSGASAADGNDVADGARLALEDAGLEAGGVAISLKVLDAGSGGSPDALAGANARRATEDSTAIAYIGELDSGATRTSLPITNEAGLLQVSPTASAVDLTRQAPGSSQIPNQVQPSGSRTFGRVIPSDAAQGAAAAGWMARSGVLEARLLGRSGAYGEALMDGFESVSDAPGLAEGDRGDAAYVVSSEPAPGLPRGVDPSSVYGADAQLVGTGPETALPADSRAVSGALAPSQLPGEGADFIDRFRSEFKRDPGRFAAYGYEAMAVVLDSVERSDDPLDRGAVVDSFFATADRDSVLGRYSIDDVGDTTLDSVGAYEVPAEGVAEPVPSGLAIP